MSAETSSKADRKPLKRRQFSVAFKRKVVREAARTSMAAVINKYELPGSSREWHNDPMVAPTKSDRRPPSTKPNGAAKPLGPQREAIVYLKHAMKAHAEGKAKRCVLLAELALSTLVGD